MRRIALNLVGRQPNTLQAVYDITEYLYTDNIPYQITNHKHAFFRAAASLPPSHVLINTCNKATYESLLHLNEKSVSASTQTLDVFNLLVFPHVYNDINNNNNQYNKYRIQNCNNIYLGMYYLDDKYQAKHNYIRSILRTSR